MFATYDKMRVCWDNPFGIPTVKYTYIKNRSTLMNHVSSRAIIRSIVNNFTRRVSWFAYLNTVLYSLQQYVIPKD